MHIGSEHSLWVNTRAMLGPLGKLERVENSVSKGFPDVAYCLRFRKRPPATGFIELKYVPTWPVHHHHPIHIQHLTLEQVLWAENWQKAGGRVWMLLQVQKTHLLLLPPIVRRIYQGDGTRGWLEHAASLTWQTPWPMAKILDLLTC